MRAEQKSLTTQLDFIDALIAQWQIDDAERELKTIQKYLYDSWSYIGVFKRYKKLGEYSEADQLMKQALKKNPENQELLAVYVDFLLEEVRNNEAGTKNRTVNLYPQKGKSALDYALQYGEKLKDGKYASLYSEAVLLGNYPAYSKKSQEEKLSFYKNDDFYNVYYDAYRGTKNPVWLRNCAVLNLLRGQFGAAAALYPGFYADADDAYFWGLTLYDSGNYYDAVQTLEGSRKLLSDFNNKKNFKVSELKLIALESDAWYAINDREKAEKIRLEALDNFDELQISEKDKDLMPVILTNSAIWYNYNNQEDKCADMLFYVVSNWPDYIPGLIQYANFAFISSQEREEDYEMKSLRKAGISTLEMEKYDSRRKIPLSDALYRINEAYKRKKNPYLEIKKMDIVYKTDKTLNFQDKITDLWNFVESNYYEAAENRNLIVEYAVHYLLTVKKYEDAWNLYTRYLKDLINFNPDEDFWKQFIMNMDKFDVPLVEYGAWFASQQKLYDETIRLYEYCVFESGGYFQDGRISAVVSNSSCMNLADIYYSNGKKDKALNLYGQVAGREMNNYKRSEIYYRMALIYAEYADKKNALRSAEYAKQIFPENAKAGLLIEKLR